MHDAIPSRILNGWLRLEEDLFHLQVLSYLPPQISIEILPAPSQILNIDMPSSYIVL